MPLITGGFVFFGRGFGSFDRWFPSTSDNPVPASRAQAQAIASEIRAVCVFPVIPIPSSYSPWEMPKNYTPYLKD
jgi:hypothetical protein